MALRATNGRTCPPRLLIVGCGSIGRRHAKNLLALGVSELSVLDIRAERRSQLASDLKVKPVTTLEEAWDQKPDAVVLAVPTSLHLPLALETAQHGCHLFIEKPLGDRWEGVDQLLRAVRQRKLISLVGCNMRFHPGLVAVKKLLEQEVVGRVIAARVEAGQYLPDWHPWEDYRQSYSARRDLGGGVILDAIHEIDYIRWLLGEVMSAVCAAGKLSRLEIETEDTAAILFRFRNGALGEIHLDYVQRAYRRTCEIIGEQGTIHWDYRAGEVRWYSASDMQWRSLAAADGWEPNQMYVDEMHHFLKCLAQEEEPALDVFEAACVLQIALAAKQSARDQRWIHLEGAAWNANAAL